MAFGEDPDSAYWWDESLDFWCGNGRISIPFLTPTGTTLIRYMEPPPRKPKGVKYWQPANSYISLYNTQAILDGGARVALCEGEVDCMSLVQCGIPAVGIPGAGNWTRRGHYPAVFEGFDEVVYIQEDDEKEFNEDGTPRQSAAERLGEQIEEDLRNVRTVRLPRGHDSNSILVTQGPDALRDIVKFSKGNQL